MRIALYLLILATPLFADGRKVIFRDMATREYRVLQDGKLTGPFKGTANGMNAQGQGPLGIVYYDGVKLLDISTEHGTLPQHTTEVMEVYRSIGEYNASQFKFTGATPLKGTKDFLFPMYFDARTGLLLTKEEAKTQPSYDGMVLGWQGGKWIGHTAGRVAPPAMVTVCAEQTRQAIAKKPRCDLPFLVL